jgi:protein TonB
VTASRFPYGWYLSVIQGKVSSNWDQPSARLLAEDSLTASVSFTIRRDGSVHGIQVSRSSGRSTVDQSAARAVRDSAPFPPLPDDYMRDTLEVTIDFTIVRE